MQRFILIGALLILSFKAFSERKSIHEGNVRKIEPINQLIDSTLALIDIEKLPDWRQYNHIPYRQCSYYRSDRNFDNIIGQIDGLKYTGAEFTSPKSKLIQKAIAKIKDTDEQMYLKLHFFYHFLYSHDVNIFFGDNKTDLFCYIGALDTSLPFTSRVKALEAYGDLFAAYGSNVSALKFYLFAKEGFEKCKLYYDAACVENKIGDLYCHINKARQLDAGFQHYYKASSLFIKAGNSIESIRSRLRSIPFTPSYQYEETNFEFLNGYIESFSSQLLGFETSASAWNSHKPYFEDDSLSVFLYEHWCDTLTTDIYHLASKRGYNFMSEAKYDSALLSFQLALSLAVHEGYPNYSLPNVIEGLNNLGWAYSYTDSFKQVFSCTQWNALLNKRSKNTLSEIHSLFSGASNFCKLQKYDLASFMLKHGIHLLDSLKLTRSVKSDIKFRETKFAMSQCDNYSIFFDVNSGYDTTERLGFVIDGDEMIRYEQIIKQLTLQQEIDDKKATLNQLAIRNDSLILKQSNLLTLSKVLAHLNDSLNIFTLLQQSKLDSGTTAIQLLNKSRENMIVEIRRKEELLMKQDEEISAKTKDLRSISSYLVDAIIAKRTAILVGCFLLSIGLGFYIVRIRSKNKSYAFLETQYSYERAQLATLEAKYNYERAQLATLEAEYNYERTKLTTLAKAKLHNIRGSYTKIMNLVDEKKYGVVAEYVENAAAYFAIILNRNNDACWTIEEELNLLRVFYYAEKIFYGDVTIIEKIDQRAMRAPFLSDIFTTLFHNAMRHAFTGKADAKIFTLEVSVLSDWLLLTISDNGAAKHSEEHYFPKDRRDNGLSILKERIVNECVYKSGEKQDNFFELHIGDFLKGTTFTFKYPYYETATKSANS